MGGNAGTLSRAVCDACGFTAADGSDEWEVVRHPPLGRVTRCPACGSTRIHSRG